MLDVMLCFAADIGVNILPGHILVGAQSPQYISWLGPFPCG